MRGCCGLWQGALALVALIGLAGAVASTGCGGGGGGAFQYLGTPFNTTRPSSTGTQAPGVSSRTTGGSLAGGGRTSVDPCLEPRERKFLRISMRNMSSSYVQYFLVLVARVQSTTWPDGGVCPEDVPTYQSAGYSLVPEGGVREFGNYCLQGPLLIYFHKSGQFRDSGGLAAAIAPAQGTSPTYDRFFGAAGQQMPVPEAILFHNPGTTVESQALKFSRSLRSPCSNTSGEVADPVCAQDSWYYVDETGQRDGSRPSQQSRSGSYVRFPSEIQGTGCECGLGNDAAANLAPSGTTAAEAECTEFFRNGRIDFVFIRDDTEPPYPQLLWRVTDANGTRAHDFDARANIH